MIHPIATLFATRGTPNTRASSYIGHWHKKSIGKLACSFGFLNFLSPLFDSFEKLLKESPMKSTRAFS